MTAVRRPLYQWLCLQWVDSGDHQLLQNRVEMGHLQATCR